jgi:hypothetical protein
MLLSSRLWQLQVPHVQQRADVPSALAGALLVRARLICTLRAVQPAWSANIGLHRSGTALSPVSKCISCLLPWHVALCCAVLRSQHGAAGLGSTPGPQHLCRHAVLDGPRGSGAGPIRPQG